MGAADVEGVGRAQGQLLVGVRGDRGLQVQGVGQVQVAVDTDPARDGCVADPDVEVPGLGRGEVFCFGGLGVEPGLGLLDQPGQLHGADGVRERRDLRVHERRSLRATGTGCGPRSMRAATPPAPPPRGGPSSAGAGNGPRPRGRGSGAPTRWNGPWPRRTRRPRTPPPPGTPARRAAGRTRASHRPARPATPPECIAAHLAAALSNSRAASSSTRFWSRAYANTLAGSSAPQSGSGSKVEVIVEPTQPPTTDTRSGPDHRCGQQVSGGSLRRTSGFQRWLRRCRDGRRATSSTTGGPHATQPSVGVHPC